MATISDPIFNSKAELLFPTHLIRGLRDLRGEPWRQLIDRVAELPETHLDSLAFVLMMVDLSECLKCNSNCYKFLRGCALCSAQTIQSFKGSDEDLVRLYHSAQKKLTNNLQPEMNSRVLSLAA